jgi:hypothetical protein
MIKRIKALVLSLIRSDLDALSSRIGALENHAERTAESQISAFSQIETRLKLLETMHGVRFEVHLVHELNKSGSGSYVAVDKSLLKRLIASLTKQWRAIQADKAFNKKWGIKK